MSITQRTGSRRHNGSFEPVAWSRLRFKRVRSLDTDETMTWRACGDVVFKFALKKEANRSNSVLVTLAAVLRSLRLSKASGFHILIPANQAERSEAERLVAMKQRSADILGIDQHSLWGRSIALKSDTDSTAISRRLQQHLHKNKIKSH
jgi:hypothetical protein